ncbi:MAG: hypothetical protein PVF51_07610 [Nitrospirota bacterium]
MSTRPAYLLLVIALLTARVTCAWGLGVDPCCSGDAGVHGASIESHVETGEPPHEDGLDHTLHASHCHCLWETVAAVEVASPVAGQPDWGAYHRPLPAAEPRGIDWPPRPCA